MQDTKTTSTFLINLLTLITQIRILHWQTKSHAQHVAFGKIYDKLSDNLDDLIEMYQGKYNCIIPIDSNLAIKLFNLSEINIDAFILRFKKYLSEEIYEKNIITDQDLDIQDLILAILNNLNKLSYLLTLK